MCVGVLMHVYLCITYVTGGHWGQKKVSDSLQLELQVVESSQMGPPGEQQRCS